MTPDQQERNRGPRAEVSPVGAGPGRGGHLVCPGCGKPKSRAAELCADCRKRANAIGATVVTQLPGASPPPVSVPRTAGQNGHYHVLCNDLARLEHPGADKVTLIRSERDHKQDALAYASRRFAREITSSTDLTRDEMSDVIEWLKDRLLTLAG